MNHTAPLKRRKSKTPGYKKAQWTQNQRLQVVSTYLMLGNMVETALVTGVPLPTIRTWKYQPWFKEASLQLKTEDVQQLDSNLKRIIDKSLKAVEDRIDLGDAQYDQKTGEIVRIPVKAHVALKISTDLIDKRIKLDEQPQKQQMEVTINDRLLKLSEEFAKFAKNKFEHTQVVDVEAKVIPSV